MKNSVSCKFLSFSAGLLWSISSPTFARSLPYPCKDLTRQLQEKLQDREKALLKKQTLENDLRESLKKEINAQIEKRDNTSEQSEAKRIYYELRRARAEAEYAETKITELKIREKNCGGKNS